MRHLLRIRIARRFPALSVLLLLALAAAALPAEAIESGPWSMEILVDGTPLAELQARGTNYVEALEGREYAIRLRNRTSERIAVALSVDGLNTIDAKTTTARAGSKWILGPYETVTLTGWQTGPATARRFFFTTEDRSYGAWLGKTSNLGVIAAAVFRERRPRPRRFDSGMSEPRSRDLPATPESRPGMRFKKERLGKSAEAEAEAEDRDSLSDEMAATGIGREVGHVVRRVRFDAESQPATTLECRYEYRDALVRLGVLRHPEPWRDDPLARRERARGFEDMDFAPDPFRRR